MAHKSPHKHILVPEEIINRVDELAAAQKRSRNQMVAILLLAAIKAEEQTHES